MTLLRVWLNTHDILMCHGTGVITSYSIHYTKLYDFAIMASQIIDQPNPKLVGIIKENLAKEDESEEFALYRTLLDFSRDNFVGTLPWLEKQYSERPLYLILNYLIATQVDRHQVALEAAEKLKNRQKNDILPHLIYLNAKLRELDTKAYAKESLSYIRAQKFEYEDLFV